MLSSYAIRLPFVTTPSTEGRCPDPCDPLAALARAPCQAIIATAWRGQVHHFWPAQRTLTVAVLALHGRGRSTLLGKLPRELLLAEVLPRALSAPRHSWRPLPSPATTWRPPLAPLRAARRAAPAAPAEQAAAPAPWLAPTLLVVCRVSTHSDGSAPHYKSCVLRMTRHVL